MLAIEGGEGSTESTSHTCDSSKMGWSAVKLGRAQRDGAGTARIV